MGDQDRGYRYDELHIDGHARVHAGSVYINIGNLNVTSQSEFNLQQLVQAQRSPRPPSAGPEAFDQANVSSPSQSSDSTDPGYGYGRMIAESSSVPTSGAPVCQIIQMPSQLDSRTKYFLDGQGLARHVVSRQIGYMAGPGAQIRCITYQRRDGYLILGNPLDAEQIARLMRQSREYEREKRIDRHLTSRD